jgi:hypothetical protein
MNTLTKELVWYSLDNISFFLSPMWVIRYTFTQYSFTIEEFYSIVYLYHSWGHKWNLTCTGLLALAHCLSKLFILHKKNCLHRNHTQKKTWSHTLENRSKFLRIFRPVTASNPDKVFDVKMLSVPKVKTLLTFAKFQSAIPGTRAASTHVCRILIKFEDTMSNNKIFLNILIYSLYFPSHLCQHFYKWFNSCQSYQGTMVLATDTPLTHFHRGNHTHIAVANFHDIVFPSLHP